MHGITSVLILRRIRRRRRVRSVVCSRDEHCSVPAERVEKVMASVHTTDSVCYDLKKMLSMWQRSQ